MAPSRQGATNRPDPRRDGEDLQYLLVTIYFSQQNAGDTGVHALLYVIGAAWARFQVPDRHLIILDPHPGRTLVGIGMLTSVDGAPCCMQAIRFYFDRESLRQCRLGKCMLRARGTQIQTPADTETVASPFAGSGNTALASSKHWGQSHTRAQLGSN